MYLGKVFKRYPVTNTSNKMFSSPEAENSKDLFRKHHVIIQEYLTIYSSHVQKFKEGSKPL